MRARRNLVVPARHRIEIVEEELPAVPDGGVLLETLATGLSAGTELAFVKGDHPGLHSRHDTELGLFRPGAAEQGYPVRRLGYMEVARVASSRTPAFRAGDVLATAYGHATAHVADPLTEHLVPLPETLDPLLGVFVAHFGPICANGLLHAAADAGPVRGLGDGVAGRLVLVTGAGPVGLMTALFARAEGWASSPWTSPTTPAGCSRPAGGTGRETTARTSCSSAAASPRPCTRRCARSGRRAASSTWRSTPRARTRCGWARSSTTTG